MLSNNYFIYLYSGVSLMHILISLMAWNSQQGPYYVSRIDSKIVLIDGDQLTQLMIDHGVGVSRVTSYEIKKIDSDYFVELLLTLGTPPQRL